MRRRPATAQLIPTYKMAETNNGSTTTDIKELPADAAGTADKGANMPLLLSKIALWTLLSPILLFILLSVIIYLPPVQKYAVDKAAAYLSESMDMDVTVSRVLLRFPLDLSIGGVMAVQEGDTVLDARNLCLSVEPLPLLREKVEVNGIELVNAKVNTRGIIPACTVRGQVGRLDLSSHSVDLAGEYALVNNLALRNSRLTVVLADSVPEDTTESEPTFWKARLARVSLDNVGLDLALAPSADKTYAGAYIGKARLKGYLDLRQGIYRAEDISIEESAACYDMCKGQAGGRTTIFQYVDQVRRDGEAARADFSPEHIFVYDFGTQIASAEYSMADGLKAKVKSAKAKERCGLEIKDLRANVRMDSLRLEATDIALETAASKFSASFKMDLNAFDDTAPGTFDAFVQGYAGKGDIQLFAADMSRQIAKSWPDLPLNVTADASGNMKSLRLNRLRLRMPGKFDLKADGIVTNALDENLIGGKAKMSAELTDINFVKGFLDSQTASSFLLPSGMKLTAQAEAHDRQAYIDADLHAAGASIMLTADYGIADETYSAGLDIIGLQLKSFVPDVDDISLTGSLTADGQGFDFFSPSTRAHLTASLKQARTGDIDLGGTEAEATLADSKFDVNFSCDNELLRTTLLLNGLLRKDEVKASADLDLPFIDLKGMGMSDERLEVTTSGRLNLWSDMGDNFDISSHVAGIDLVMGKNNISTEELDIAAFTNSDTTAATISSGDLSFRFNAPDNLFGFISSIQKTADAASEQLKHKELNLDKLKAYMPVSAIKASAGSDNPLSRIMAAKGIKFADIKADIQTAPDFGITGDAHVYHLTNDTIKLDTAFVQIWQDSSRLAFKSGLICDDQKLCPAFSAYINGYAGFDEADARLTFFNKKKEKGVDLGVRANARDSVIHMSLYPEEPVIAFRKFALNDNNYIELRHDGGITADVDLASKEDSCTICIASSPSDGYLQDATASIRNLNIAELMKVLPFMPDMSGMLNVDARYLQTEDNFTVSTDIDTRGFTYEGMGVGDLRTTLLYVPAGQDTHDVTGTVDLNGRSIADIEGSYNAAGDGSLKAKLALKRLPLSVVSPFIPDHIVAFGGSVTSTLNVEGPMDKLVFNGVINPDSVTMTSDMYAVNMRFADDPITISNSRLNFDKYKIYGSGENPLTLHGYVDFANLDEPSMGLSLYGRDFQLINAKRTRKSIIFGKMYGDFFARVTGTTNDLTIRGLVNVLSSTDMTYIMDDTPLSVDYRLDDIVTFTDFTLPPDTTMLNKEHVFTGLDMSVQLQIQDGAYFHCEFSADRQSYVDVQGGGSMVLNYTPEGVLTLQGRYTVNEGEMKYTLPVIPLKTFTLTSGSYIDFTGDPMNPTLNIAATERTKATVADDNGKSRSVSFDVGLKITNTLENMGLEFTIDAPEDMTIQNELAGYSTEEKNKLAVALLATGMYLSSTNSSGFTAGNALNSFLQNEINNIAGQALSTAVDVNVGMEQSTLDDGSTRTDYSFKFSKRFFSNRLSVVIGGKVSSDNNGGSGGSSSGAYIDDVSLEWRLDDGGTRYVRLFHEKNYDNLFEGELVENGAGMVLRKKMNNLSELFIFNEKKRQAKAQQRRGEGGGKDDDKAAAAPAGSEDKKEKTEE